MTDLDRVLRHINPARLERLLMEMLEIYSPPYAEGPIVRHVAQFLRDRGLPVELQPVPAGPTDDRANILVSLGPADPSVLWIGHLDTVELWHEGGHRPKRDGDIIRGLGTADMKAGCAAAIEALIALHESGVTLKSGVVLGLVVGEEEAGDGAHVLREYVSAPLTVIGEPTSLVPCVNHFGYLELLVESRGKRAHAALPEVGANAIHAMLEVVLAVLEDRVNWPDSDEIALSVRRIAGGQSHFVIADHCEAQIDVHLPPGATPDAVEASFRAAIERACVSHDGVELELKRLFWAPGFDSAPNDARIAPLESAFGAVGLDWAPSAFRSHSDANLFHDRGTLTVVCGPGALDVAHRRSEFVSLTEAHAACRLYAALFANAASKAS